MKNIPTMIDGQTSLEANDFNQIPNELENTITDSGQILDGGDLNQLGKALTKSACAYDFYEDTGTPNSIILNAVGHQPLISYTNGLKVRFYTSNSNTGATTVNIDGLGLKPIVDTFNNILQPNTLQANNYYEIIYNALLDKFIFFNGNISLGSGQDYSALSIPNVNFNYINDTGRSIFVIVSGQIKSGTGFIRIMINDIPITNQSIYETNSTGALTEIAPFSFSFVVANNKSYKIETNINFNSDGEIKMSILS